MTKGNQGRFLLLYGSQTGQAKAIAEEIFETSPNHGLDPEMHCFSMTDKKFSIEKEKCVVIVVSTTGDGEPPDTATKFWRRIKKKTLPSDHLSGLHFTLLGLGDSNYTNFCRNGKNFNQRLEELGASHFYPPGFADDATGLEIVAEPWMEGLYPALRKHLGLDGAPDSRANGPVVGTDGSGLSQSVEGINEIITRNSESVNHVVNDTSTDSPPSDNAPSSDAKVTDVSSVSTLAKTKDKKVTPEELTEVRTGDQVSSILKSEADSTSTKQSSLQGAENRNTTDAKTSNIDQPDSSQLQNEVKSGEESKPEDSIQQKSSTEKAISSNDTSVEEQGNGGEVIEEGASSVRGDGPSLVRSVPPLSESSLTLPVLPPPFLEVEFHADQTVKVEELPLQGGAPMPSAASTVTMATLVSATRLTRDDSVKTALDMELDISGSEIHYEPGDSFSIICPNDNQEVADLIQRLGLCEKADCPFSLKVLSGTKKRRAAVPEYIPQPLCTLRHALLHCCDIRTPPKKAFLRVLVDYTNDESEKRRLQELCSKQGSSDYGAYIRDPHMSLLDVLAAFPSCNPPLSRLFEHLPRLQPRPYSVSSSPLVDPCKLHFVFNIVVFPEGQGRAKQREGVCTGWLSHMTQNEQNANTSLTGQMSKLTIHAAPKIPIFGRNNQHFHLPSDPATPIVMIGPGTGVAPFVGFLEHRECLQRTGACLGPAWLFFGCRHRDRDFLYREVLEGHLATSVLSKLCLSFSRDHVPPETEEMAEAGNMASDVPRYVQDNMRRHATALCHLILEDRAVVYVCGDAKNMAKNVSETLKEIFIQETGKTAYEAACLLASLREEKRYLEDVWT